MDLASGYSDSTNYGNGYTPLANNAINNNNAAYNANQAYANAVGQYDPFAQSGGFGTMTDYYSGLGRDYTTATGGNIFGNASGGGGGGSSTSYSGGGIGSDAGQSSAEQAYSDWYKSLNNGQLGTSSGYDLGGASGKPAVDQTATSIPSFWQGVRDTFGADPKDQTSLQTYSGGGIGSDAVGAQNQPGSGDLYGSGVKAAVDQTATSIPSTWQSVRDYFGADPKDQSQVQQSVFDTGTSAFNPYASQPWWSTFEQSAGPQGVTDWLRGKGISSSPSQSSVQPVSATGPYGQTATLPDPSSYYEFQTQPDKQMEQTPYGIWGNEGTLDKNSVDPYDMQDNKRDAIAKAIMAQNNQAWVNAS